MIWVILAVGAFLLLFAGVTVANTVPQAKVKLFAEAIAFAEGFWDLNRTPRVNNRSYRDNNPGDIEGTGTAGSDGPYRKNASANDGWADLYKQVEYDLSGKSAIYQAPGNAPFSAFTVSDYAYSYTATDPDGWSDNVAAFLTANGAMSVTRDTRLADWLAA